MSAKPTDTERMTILNALTVSAQQHEKGRGGGRCTDRRLWHQRMLLRSNSDSRLRLRAYYATSSRRVTRSFLCGWLS